MATYHIGSFDSTTAQGIPATGRVIAVTPNPYNNNQCVALDDNNFNQWGAQSTKVQKVPGAVAGRWIAVMPFTSGGTPTFYGFTSDGDLLNNAQFVPDFSGGTIGSGVFSTANDVAVTLSNLGGMLIDPAGNVIVS